MAMLCNQDRRKEAYLQYYLFDRQNAKSEARSYLVFGLIRLTQKCGSFANKWFIIKSHWTNYTWLSCCNLQLRVIYSKLKPPLWIFYYLNFYNFSFNIFKEFPLLLIIFPFVLRILTRTLFNFTQVLLL